MPAVDLELARCQPEAGTASIAGGTSHRWVGEEGHGGSLARRRWSATEELMDSWGVYADLDDRIYVSDIDSGAYVLQLDAIRGEIDGVEVEPPAPRQLAYQVSYRNATATPATAFAAVSLLTTSGQPTPIVLHWEIQRLQPLQHHITNHAFPLPSGAPPGLTFGLRADFGRLQPLVFGQPMSISITVP